MGVLSFTFKAFIAPEKSVMIFFSFMANIVKPIKGFNFELWALAPDGGTHDA